MSATPIPFLALALCAAPAAGPAAAPMGGPAAGAPQQDDPTVLDARLRAALSTQATSAAGDPALSVPGLPTLVLRGLVIARGKPGAALVEGGGVLHRAEQGSVLQIALTPHGVHELRVVALTRDELRLESVTTGATLVLR